MLLQRSRLPAAGLERPRLVQPWLLLTLGGLTVVVLVAIFPYQALVDRVVAGERGDPLTTSYLHNLLRTDPDNPELRLSLARQQGASGDIAAARRTLAPLIASREPALRREALWTSWLIGKRALERTLGAAAEDERRRELLRQLKGIAGEDWHDETLAQLTAQAIQLGDLRLAVDLQSRAEQRGAKMDAGWLARAAQLALGGGDYRYAAQLYLEARRRAAARAERRAYFLAAVGVLQSGNLPGEAIELADANLGELSADQDVLYRLVELARAANRLDLADKYARLLLRLSLLQQLLAPDVAAAMDFRVVRVAATAGSPSAVPGGGPKLPFDDKIYSLGYEVFLANRKLEDAYQVAAAAVRQAPQSAAWRLKLARVAEWTQRPAEALVQWRWLAQREDSEEAWQAVLRLAPGLFDDAALLEALLHQAARHRPDERRIRELVAIYERLGDPEGGLATLDRLYAAQPSSELLDAMAQLAERAGDDDRAVGYWRRAIAQGGATRERALHLASLLVARGDVGGASRVLQQASERIPPDADDFWRLYGQLAHLSQKDDDALLAYERLLAGGKAAEADYAALLALLRDVNPARAARLAEQLWHQFGRFTYFLQALDLWSGEAQWVEVGRLLALLPPSQLSEAERTLEFLRLRARFYQQTGQLRLAQRDMERVLALAPDDSGTREALLWLAIDGNDPSRLRALLGRKEAAWMHDAALQDALAAAHQALSQPRIALARYLTPRLATHRDDFLWLMNYADALEQDGATDRAWRLREYLWHRTRAPGFVLGEAELAAVRRVARARLAAAQRPGDSQFALMRELVALDRADGTPLSPQVKEMVAAWLQNAGEYTAVRGFLWQQYARDLNKPLWAQITAALAIDDRSDIAELLERYGERLPRSDRIEAARRVGDAALAQSYAFDAQELQPDDDAIHQQLAELLLDGSDRAQLAFDQRQMGVVDERPAALDIGLGLAPDLRLFLDLGRIGRSSSNDSVITNVPPLERYAQAALAWRHDDGETRLALGWRDSFAAFEPIALQRDQNIDRNTGLTLRFGHHLPAPESAALLVAGMKDLFGVAAHYQATSRDRLAAEWSYARYFGQTGTYFGNGEQWNAEYAHALRSEVPDMQFSAFLSGSRFSGDPGASDAALGVLVPGGGPATAAFFIPEGASLWGLRLSSNVRLRQDYTRALQPLFSVALTQSGTLGPGYDLLFGIAGSILGNDHFQIGWNLTKGGSAAFNRTRDVGVSYRLYF